MNSIVMECHDKAGDRLWGKQYAHGDTVQLSLRAAYSLYKQDRWKPRIGKTMTAEEAAALNAHFAKAKIDETSEKPKKVTTSKSTKTSK